MSDLEQELEQLREALEDLIEAAQNRVPGDDALWALRIEEAQAALDRSEGPFTT
jgi:hypothetical protein